MQHVWRTGWFHIGLAGRHEGKIPLGRSTCKCEDNIKMDLKEGRSGDMEWVVLAVERDRWRVL